MDYRYVRDVYENAQKASERWRQPAMFSKLSKEDREHLGRIESYLEAYRDKYTRERSLEKIQKAMEVVTGERERIAEEKRAKRAVEKPGEPVIPDMMKDFWEEPEPREKGEGWLGEITDHKGRTMTELSIGVEIDGSEREIPLLVPGLTDSEIEHLKAGKDPTDEIVDKAVEHAEKQLVAGKSPFRGRPIGEPMTKVMKSIVDPGHDELKEPLGSIPTQVGFKRAEDQYLYGMWQRTRHPLFEQELRKDPEERYFDWGRVMELSDHIALTDLHQALHPAPADSETKTLYDTIKMLKDRVEILTDTIKKPEEEKGIIINSLEERAKRLEEMRPAIAEAEASGDQEKYADLVEQFNDQAEQYNEMLGYYQKTFGEGTKHEADLRRYSDAVEEYNALFLQYSDAVEEYNRRVEGIPDMEDILKASRNLNNPAVQQELIREALKDKTFEGTDIPYPVPMSDVHKVPERDRGKAFVRSLESLLDQVGYQFLYDGKIWGVPDVFGENPVQVMSRHEVEVIEATKQRLKEELAQATTDGEKGWLTARIQAEDRKLKALREYSKLEGEVLEGTRELDSKTKGELNRLHALSGLTGDAPLQRLEDKVTLLQLHAEAMELDPTTTKAVYTGAAVIEGLVELAFMAKFLGLTGLVSPGTARGVISPAAMMFAGRSAVKSLPYVETKQDFTDAIIGIAFSGLTGQLFDAIGKADYKVIKRIVKTLMDAKKPLMTEAAAQSLAEMAIKTPMIIGATTTVDLAEAGTRETLDRLGIDVEAKPVTLESIAQNAMIMAALRLKGAISKYPHLKKRFESDASKRWREGRFTLTEQITKRTDIKPNVDKLHFTINPRNVENILKERSSNKNNLIRFLTAAGYKPEQVAEIISGKKTAMITLERQWPLVDRALWSDIKRFAGVTDAPHEITATLGLRTPTDWDMRPVGTEPKWRALPLPTDEDLARFKVAEQKAKDEAEAKRIAEEHSKRLAESEKVKKKLVASLNREIQWGTPHEKLVRKLELFNQNLENYFEKLTQADMQEVLNKIEEVEGIISKEMSKGLAKDLEDALKDLGVIEMEAPKPDIEMPIFTTLNTRFDVKDIDQELYDKVKGRLEEKLRENIKAEKDPDKVPLTSPDVIKGDLDKWIDLGKKLGYEKVEEKKPLKPDIEEDEKPEERTVVIPDVYKKEDLEEDWTEDFEVSDKWKEHLAAIEKGERRYLSAMQGEIEIWKEGPGDYRAITEKDGKVVDESTFTTIGDMFAKATGWGADDSWRKDPKETAPGKRDVTEDLRRRYKEANVLAAVEGDFRLLDKLIEDMENNKSAWEKLFYPEEIKELDKLLAAVKSDLETYKEIGATNFDQDLIDEYEDIPLDTERPIDNIDYWGKVVAALVDDPRNITRDEFDSEVLNEIYLRATDDGDEIWEEIKNEAISIARKEGRIPPEHKPTKKPERKTLPLTKKEFGDPFDPKDPAFGGLIPTAAIIDSKEPNTVIASNDHTPLEKFEDFIGKPVSGFFWIFDENKQGIAGGETKAFENIKDGVFVSLEDLDRHGGDFYDAAKEIFEKRGEAKPEIVEDKKQKDLDDLSKRDDINMDWQMVSPEVAREKGWKMAYGQVVRRGGNITGDDLIHTGGKTQKYIFARDGAVEVSSEAVITVVEAVMLKPSHIMGAENHLHFVPEGQPKDRSQFSTDAAKLKAKQWNPDEATEVTTNPYSGVPHVNERGEVIQGNDRTNIMKWMYSMEPERAKMYKDYLIEHAADFGLDPEKIKKIGRPILVAVHKIDDNTFIRLGQKSAVDRETGAERKIDPRRVVRQLTVDDKFNMFTSLVWGESEASLRATLDVRGTDVLEWLYKNGYISRDEFESNVSRKTGKITPEGKQFVETAMTYQLFEGGRPDLDKLFDGLPQHGQRALIKAASSINSREIPERMSILRDVQNAIAGYVEFKKSKVGDVLAWAQQMEAFEESTPVDRYGGIAVWLIDKLNKTMQSFPLPGGKKISTMNMLGEILEYYGNTARGDFGALFPSEAASRDELFVEAIDLFDKDPKKVLIEGRYDRERRASDPDNRPPEKMPPNTDFDKYDEARDRGLADSETIDGNYKPYGNYDKQRSDEIGAKDEKQREDLSDDVVDLDGAKIHKRNLDELDSIFGDEPPPKGDIERAGIPGFQEHKYEQALPFLRNALQDTVDSGQDIKDFVKTMQKRFGETINPYLRQMVEDLKRGEIVIDYDTKRRKDVTGTAKDLERDRRERGIKDTMGRDDVPDQRPGEVDRDLRPPGEKDVEGVPGDRDLGVPDGLPPVDGERGDKPIFDRDGAAGTSGGTPGGGQRGRGSGVNDDGVPFSAKGTEDSQKTVEKVIPTEVKIKFQIEALKQEIKLGDRANIEKTLPMLRPEQIDDVFTAEQRYYGRVNPGKGFLFTNQTGTGKTFVGLGIIARQYAAGNQNILIVVPNEQTGNQWSKAAEYFGLPMNKVPDTSSKGKGLRFTTYANFRVNDKLGEEIFDLVVMDESHNIKSGQEKAADPVAIERVKKIANVTSAALERAQREIGYERRATEIYSKKYENFEDGEREIDALNDEMAKRAQEIADSTKVLMLSATPFAYISNLDLADGILFDINESTGGQIPYPDERNIRGAKTPKDYFIAQHFGLRLARGKVTKVPQYGVDVGERERNFHNTLVDMGVASFRKLETNKDYSRDFVQTITDETSIALDEGFKVLSAGLGGDPELQDLAVFLAKNKHFNYLRKTQLLEAIKARHTVERIKKHWGLGRKVIVYHTYNKALPPHPFHFDDLLMMEGVDPKVISQIELFNRKYSHIRDLDLHGLMNPIETFKKAFGEDNVGVYNGVVPRDKRRQTYEDFMNDDGDLKLLVVQMEAGREGVNLQDTTGKYQRALIVLGIPNRSTACIQIEGRINRLFTMTDSVIEYITTGLYFELLLYAETVANRVQTVENLATGEYALNLQRSFRQGYLDSHKMDPHEGQGTGGKISDGALDRLTDWERAVHYYWERVNKKIDRQDFAGRDYQPTPEPIGYKMVQFADARPSESSLEPSAGDGSGIGQWFSTLTRNTFIEPSYELYSILGIKTDGIKLNMMFENLKPQNKYHTIVMVPPADSKGNTVQSHIEKAADKHLRDGGRLVTIVKGVGPTLSGTNLFFKWRDTDDLSEWGLTSKEIKAQNEEHQAKTPYYIVANIILPGWAVDKNADKDDAYTLLVIDKQLDKEKRPNDPFEYEGKVMLDLTDAKNMRDLFKKMKDIEVPGRDVDESRIDTSVTEIPGMKNKTLSMRGGREGYLAQFDIFVPKWAYQTLEEIAKGLGGRYHNKGYDNDRGFVFPTEKAREDFYGKAYEIMERLADNKGTRVEDHVYKAEIKASKKEIEQALKSKSTPEKGRDRENLEDANKVYEEVLSELEGKERPARKVDPKEAPTKSGKILAKRIADDTQGEKYGLRTIMRYLAEKLPVKVIERKEQLTRKHPAHFRSDAFIIRAKSESSLLISHEVGHAIRQYILENKPDAFKGYEDALIHITKMEESYASAKNASEGFAEWLRRYVAYPESVQGMFVTGYIEKLLKTEFPDIWNLIKDVQVATAIHFNRSLLAQFRSFSKDVSYKGVTLKEQVDQIANTVMFAMSKGYGIQLLDRKIIRSIIKNAKNHGLSQKEALKLAKSWREYVEKEKRLDASYQLMVRLPAEIIENTQGEYGLRIIDRDTHNYKQMGPMTIGQIMRYVGNENWNDFETYMWAVVSKERWDKKRIEYPGKHSGVKPRDLEDIASDLRTKHPKMEEWAAMIKALGDALVQIRVEMGEISDKEAERIIDSYEQYAHLGRQFAPVGVWGHQKKTGIGTEPRSGAMPLRGGSEAPFLDLKDAMEKITASTLSGYYNNFLMLEVNGVIEKTVHDKTLPWESRKLARSLVLPLDKDIKVAAHLSPMEQKVIIAKGMNDLALQNQIKMYMKETGIKDLKTLREEYPEAFDLEVVIKPEDLNLALGYKPIYRALKPNAINIIAPYDPLTKTRTFYQVDDPFTYLAFAASPRMKGSMRVFYQITKDVLRAWKDTVTGSTVFAINNLFYRNLWTGVAMADNWRASLDPSFLTLRGIFDTDPDRFSKRLGETFGKALSHQGAMSERNYFKQVAKEFTRATELLKYWNDPDANLLTRLWMVGGIINELVLTPINVLWTLTGSRQFSLWGEERIRRGAALMSKKRGDPDSVSNMWYDHIAGNFGEKSGYAAMEYAIGTAPFVGPAVKTHYRFTLHATDPLEWKKNIFKLMWAAIILPTAFWLLREFISNEADKKRYAERSDIDKFTHFDMKGMRIPYYPGSYIGFGQSLTINLLDSYVAGRSFASRQRFAENLLLRLVALPGPTSWMQPQVRSLIETKVNYNFFLNRQIEPAWMQFLPVQERRYETTPEIYSDISRFLGLSPVKLEHIVNQGVSMQYGHVLNLMQMSEDGRLDAEYLRRNPAEVPFFGRLFIRKPMGFSGYPAEKMRIETGRVEKELSKAIRRMRAKYGEDYQQSEEMRAITEQVAYLLHLRTRRDQMQQINREIRDYRKARKGKLTNEDWLYIEERMQHMKSLAWDGIMFFDEKDD